MHGNDDKVFFFSVCFAFGRYFKQKKKYSHRCWQTSGDRDRHSRHHTTRSKQTHIRKEKKRGKHYTRERARLARVRAPRGEWKHNVQGRSFTRPTRSLAYFCDDAELCATPPPLPSATADSTSERPPRELRFFFVSFLLTNICTCAYILAYVQKRMNLCRSAGCYWPSRRSKHVVLAHHHTHTTARTCAMNIRMLRIIIR